MDRERAYLDQMDGYGDEEFMSTPQQMKRHMRAESIGRDMGHNRGSQNSRNSDGNYPPGYRNSMQKSPGNSHIRGTSFKYHALFIVFSTAANRAQSLDRRMFRRDPQMVDFEEEGGPGKTPILCNKYALDDMEERASPGGPRGGPGADRRSPINPRSQSMPRQSRYGDRLMPDRMPYYNEENEMAMQAAARKQPPPHPAAAAGRRRELRPGKSTVCWVNSRKFFVSFLAWSRWFRVPWAKVHSGVLSKFGQLSIYTTLSIDKRKTPNFKNCVKMTML